MLEKDNREIQWTKEGRRYALILPWNRLMDYHKYFNKMKFVQMTIIYRYSIVDHTSEHFSMVS